MRRQRKRNGRGRRVQGGTGKTRVWQRAHRRTRPLPAVVPCAVVGAVAALSSPAVVAGTRLKWSAYRVRKAATVAGAVVEVAAVRRRAVSLAAMAGGLTNTRGDPEARGQGRAGQGRAGQGKGGGKGRGKGGAGRRGRGQGGEGEGATCCNSNTHVSSSSAASVSVRPFAPLSPAVAAAQSPLGPPTRPSPRHGGGKHAGSAAGSDGAADGADLQRPHAPRRRPRL